MNVFFFFASTSEASSEFDSNHAHVHYASIKSKTKVNENLFNNKVVSARNSQCYILASGHVMIT